MPSPAKSGELLIRPRVLAVDDDSAVLDLIAQALAAEGFVVCTASSVEEFNELEAKSSFDLYIVDVTLPDGNGFEIVRVLRRKSRRGIILLTGRGSEIDQVLGLELGADDYIIKPFRLRPMLARVNAVLRRTMVRNGDEAGQASYAARSSDQTHGADYTFTGYQLSVASRQVWNSENVEVHLTTAEFNLLVVLVSNSGRVLSRDQIMSAMRGRDWECDDRAVDGLVSRLRRKLPGQQGETSPIRTIHGVGYVFRR